MCFSAKTKAKWNTHFVFMSIKKRKDNLADTEINIKCT